MIWRRTVILFFLTLATSTAFGMLVYRDSRPLPGCIAHEDNGPPPLSVVQDNGVVSFHPCYVDGELPAWEKLVAISCFLSWVAFLSSIAQDCFLYFRGRRRGTISGRFKLLR